MSAPELSGLIGYREEDSRESSSRASRAGAVSASGLTGGVSVISGAAIEPDRREIARYLGYRGVVPDEKVSLAIERCVEQLKEACRPQEVHAVFRLDEATERGEKSPESAGSADLIRFAGVEWHSRNLSRNLRGCAQIILFAATRGPGPDQLIRRASVSKVSDMVIYQAASAAMIEAYCDRLNTELKAAAAQDGLFLRPRYSPGYGDLALESQKDLIRLLDAPRGIGVTLTESLLMAPSKSVTAVIGVSEEEKPCPLSGCEACNMKNCAFRRNT